MLHLNQINKNWTLFLDRDGVINHEKKADYILNWNEFKFYDGVLEAIAKLNHQFKTIVMVTNQKGVGRKLMSVDDLHFIHKKMMEEINNHGGRIDKIYFCPDLDETSPNRKPNAGMAFQAKKDFPNINFKQSIIVGNKLTDMNFGRNAGMHTVFVATTNPETSYPHTAIDLRFDNLLQFAQALTKT